MNKEEIEKILDRLERIDHKDYRCSFEFADSGSFEETCRCFEERKKLANYIKELQQENKQLKDNWNKLKEEIQYQLERQYDIDEFAKEQGFAFYNPVRLMIEHFRNKIQELENK